MKHCVAGITALEVAAALVSLLCLQLSCSVVVAAPELSCRTPPAPFAPFAWGAAGSADNVDFLSDFARAANYQETNARFVPLGTGERAAGSHTPFFRGAFTPHSEGEPFSRSMEASEHEVDTLAAYFAQRQLKVDTLATATDVWDEATVMEMPVVPTVIEHGDKATITYPDGIELLPTDWVGVYSPPDRADDDALDWRRANSTDTRRMSFVLLNMRAEYQFRYFRQVDTKFRLLAASPIVSFKQGRTQPLHGHIALTERSNEMRVSWTSAKSGPSHVRVWPVDDEASADTAVVFAGSVTTYTAEDMCSAPATQTSATLFMDPGYMHTVVLTGLKHGQPYRYQFGSDSGGWSAVHSFKAAPAVGSREPVRVIVFGDMGVKSVPNASSGTAKRMLQDILPSASAAADIDAASAAPWRQDLVLHIGDIAYGYGRGYVWEQFMSLIEPVATKVPYMVTIGNHEFDHTTGTDPSGLPPFKRPWTNYGEDSMGECGVPTQRRFVMPASPGGRQPWWYSFDYGMVHFVALSLESDFTADSEQRRWLEADLKAVNREVTPWVVVTGHRPMYCSVASKSDFIMAEQIRASMESLFQEYQVNLALWGHYHSYERTCPLDGWMCKGDESRPQGVVHVVVGTAGYGVDDSIYYDVPWSACRIRQYGFSRLAVHDARTLTLEFVQNSDAAVLDSIRLTNRIYTEPKQQAHQRRGDAEAEMLLFL